MSSPSTRPRSVVVWVLAEAGDTSRDMLDPAPEDGTLVFLENLRRFRNDEPLLNVVDKTRGY